MTKQQKQMRNDMTKLRKAVMISEVNAKAMGLCECVRTLSKHSEGLGKFPRRKWADVETGRLCEMDRSSSSEEHRRVFFRNKGSICELGGSLENLNN